MAFKDAFQSKINETPVPNDLPDRISGSIIHVNSRGFGFIQSRQIPFERIYFYWQALNQDTKRFPELEKGMKVEFTPLKYTKGWRAIKIKVM